MGIQLLEKLTPSVSDIPMNGVLAEHSGHQLIYFTFQYCFLQISPGIENQTVCSLLSEHHIVENPFVCEFVILDPGDLRGPGRL